MCGIAGYAPRDAAAPVEPDRLLRMTQTLVHRGPDGEGMHAAPGIALGVRRLAIVDVEHGAQPIASEDGDVVLVCNGEIYNAPELRARLRGAGHRFRSRSDVEVAVHLYEEHGLRFVEHLRGMFALALWDARRRRLVLARDRLGIKPLCWAETRQGLWFASEAKAILAGGCVDREVDLAALRDLFTFGFVLTPRTMLARVRRLEPGCLLVHEHGRTRTERYWQVAFPERGAVAARSDDEWAEALRAKLEEVVRIHLRSDVPVGVLLSGGLDSSSVASLACSLNREPVRAYSVGFDVAAFDEVGTRRFLSDFPGFALERRTTVAEAGDLGSLPQVVWSTEEPSTTANGLWRLRLAALAARERKVVLAGEGADEVLGGYRWYHGQRILGPLGRLPLGIRKVLALGLRHRPGAARLLLAPPVMDLERFATMLAPETPSEMTAVLAPEVAQAVARLGPAEEPALPAELSRWHPFDRLQFYDLKVRLTDFINHTLDRATMAHSLEVRVPFLDHELVELCCAMPPGVRMRRLREKAVLRRAMRGRLPEEIRRRPKRGTMAPSVSWLRAPLPEVLAAELSPRRLAATGYFSPVVVQRQLEEHRAGAADRRHDLLAVLSMQLWHALFIEGRDVDARHAAATVVPATARSAARPGAGSR